MSEPNAAVPASDREQKAVPVAPNVPVDPSVNTWSRFITTFEASEFTDWIDESLSWKKTCHIGDWSPLLKIRVRGPDSKAFFEYLSTNHWPKFQPNQAKHAIFCRDNGTIIGEGVLMMLGHDDFIFTSVPGVTWAVQGPSSVAVMEAATKSSITDLKFMHSRKISIDGHSFLCLRGGVSGEQGFELWGPAEEAHAVYRAILSHGSEFGIRQLGYRAKAVNHVEGAFLTPWLDFLPSFQGDDLDLVEYRRSHPSAHHRTPFDLVWGWLVNFDHDFIGKETLKEIASDPPNALVTLEWNSQDVTDVYASLFCNETLDFVEMPRDRGGVEGSGVYDGGRLIGCAVSRYYSYWFKKMISLCIIEVKYSTPGTEVMVKWGDNGSPQKMIRAVVRPAPYKEDQRKKPLVE
ncbi:FAD dependent oxidoreductase [Fusarium bulbicola]|nr:FAD dependent oxidoreductase [Fusarium bulbicola]